MHISIADGFQTVDPADVKICKLENGKVTDNCPEYWGPSPDGRFSIRSGKMTAEHAGSWV